MSQPSKKETPSSGRASPGKKKSDSHCVGFDLGGTKMLAVTYDENLQPVGRCRKKTKGHEGQAAGLTRICETIGASLEDAGISPDKLSSIGIGCPGPLDLKRGVIREAPNLGWKDVPVQKTLESEFGCPVVVANDVDAGVFGEYVMGAGKGAHCVVGIFPGTGIGGGCVYRGQLIQGKNCTCMEIGHIPILSDGPLDGAGNRGTLESVASRLAIAAGAAQAAYRGQAPYLREKFGTDIGDIRSGALRDSLDHGDKAVEALLDQAAQHLATAVVTMMLLMAPDVVILGGGLVEAMPKSFVENVQQHALRRLLPAYRGLLRVVPAELGDNATVLGAAAWARASK